MFLNSATLKMIQHVLLIALVGGALAFIQSLAASVGASVADPLTAGFIGMLLASATRLLQAEQKLLDTPPPPSAPVTSLFNSTISSGSSITRT